MRYMLPLAVFLASALPARATEKPSAEDRETMWTQIQTSYAGAFCPDYRVNVYQLGAYLKAHGFPTVRSVSERFPEYYEEMRGDLPSSDYKDRPKACLDLWDKMGDFGIYPHILVHR